MARPKSESPKKCIIKVRMTEEEKAELEKFSEEYGYSVSDTIRYALDRFYEVEQIRKKIAGCKRRPPMIERYTAVYYEKFDDCPEYNYWHCGEEICETVDSAVEFYFHPDFNWKRNEKKKRFERVSVHDPYDEDNPELAGKKSTIYGFIIELSNLDISDEDTTIPEDIQNLYNDDLKAKQEASND